MVKLLWLVDAVVGVLTLLFVVATAWIAAELLLGDSGQARLMVIYSVGLFFGTLDTASGSILRVLNRFAASFGAAAAGSVGRLALIVSVVVAGGGLEALIWARAGAELLYTLVQGAVTLRVAVPVLWADRRTPIGVLRGRFGEIGRFLVSSNLIGTLRTASTKLDVIVVGLIASPLTVGLYRIAVRFGTTPLLLGDALLTAVYPRFARDVVLKRTDVMRHIAARTTLIVAVIVLPAALFAAIAGNEVITLLAGSAYDAAGSAFALCFAGASVAVLWFWAPALIMATGHASRLLAIVAAAVVVQFGGLLVLVPEFGAAGAAGALAASQLVLVTLQIGFVRRRRLLGDRVRERSSPTFAQ
jgi:O-antigen/teichoic acid export membrane protein